MQVPTTAISIAAALSQLLLLFQTRCCNSQPTPTLTVCSGDTNYTVPGTFKTNLDLLLANLSTTAPTATAHFLTANSGPVYGLVQCRGDASPPNCAACLNRTAAEITSLCPFRTAAAVRYDFCLLRYSDRRFFSEIEDAYTRYIANGASAYDQQKLSKTETELMAGLMDRASAVETRFAVDVLSYSALGASVNVYGMVQCTRDLLPDNCYLCLQRLVGAYPKCCYGRVGAQVLVVSCNVRYELQPFFSTSILPAPPPAIPPTPALQHPPPPPQVPVAGGTNGTGGDDTGGRSNRTRTALIVVIPIVAGSFILLLVICFVVRKRRREERVPLSDKRSGVESLLFDLETLREATNFFSDTNKLGEGGFGSVYKGTLPDGQEIAVKRLSGGSGQGVVELRNEVVLLVKLQHRNLVRLLGCCLDEDEKLLVYEYLPNSSVDKFLFDPVKRLLLDWKRRYKIIEGIARGLLYLHEDSRLRIIHRDMKASNILLDREMIPKISDFGLAKLFFGDQTQGNTSRIAGTYGYMAPEYLLHGIFSNKSDVFSYGVLVLELVTGLKNTGFRDSTNARDLLTYVWDQWNEGTVLQVLDRSLGVHYQQHEVLRCIHIGLLCIQDDAAKRPNMSSVVLMLNSYSLTLPSPSLPAFFSHGSARATSQVDSSHSGLSNKSQNMREAEAVTANEMSVTELEPR